MHFPLKVQCGDPRVIKGCKRGVLRAGAVLRFGILENGSPNPRAQGCLLMSCGEGIKGKKEKRSLRGQDRPRSFSVCDRHLRTINHLDIAENAGYTASDIELLAMP